MEMNAVEKQWHSLLKRDDKFASERMKADPPAINRKLDPHVPKKLRQTLNTAFNKAFVLIFEKGSPIIEKTYNKENYQYDYKLSKYSFELKHDRKSLKRFRKKASKARFVNTAISCASGIGMGLVGCGLPDIPVFLSAVLKSIYETALSYGYGYEDEKERLFILRIMETALLQGVPFAKANTALNKLIDSGAAIEGSLAEQIQRTAQSMTDAMIYMKFVQGIFLVGAVGGAWDVIYMKRITEYAMLKYERRLLKDMADSKGVEK